MAIIDTSKVTIPKGFFEDLNVPKLLEWLNSQPTADVVPRDEVQEIFKEFDRMLERYAYEPYYTVQDMEIEVNILKEKYIQN